jgi:hypothetical protein
VCVRNSWSCLKLNDFVYVYVYVYVEVFSRFIVKRFLKDITEVKSYVTVLS